MNRPGPDCFNVAQPPDRSLVGVGILGVPSTTQTKRQSPCVWSGSGHASGNHSRESLAERWFARLHAADFLWRRRSSGACIFTKLSFKGSAATAKPIWQSALCRRSSPTLHFRDEQVAHHPRHARCFLGPGEPLACACHRLERVRRGAIRADCGASSAEHTADAAM